MQCGQGETIYFDSPTKYRTREQANHIKQLRQQIIIGTGQYPIIQCDRQKGRDEEAGRDGSEREKV